MAILLRKLTPVIFSVILGLVTVAQFHGQRPIDPNFTGNKSNTVNADYPLLPNSIMDAELIRTDGQNSR